jgi:hypothetical protein
VLDEILNKDIFSLGKKLIEEFILPKNAKEASISQ